MRTLKRHMGAIVLCAGFLLGVKDGSLALWKEPDPEPVMVFSCRVSSLPPADQLMLKRGIKIPDTQQLLMALEDYL